MQNKKNIYGKAILADYLNGCFVIYMQNMKYKHEIIETLTKFILYIYIKMFSYLYLYSTSFLAILQYSNISDLIFYLCIINVYKMYLKPELRVILNINC